MECGFKKWIECTEECRWFSTCTRNPHRNKAEAKEPECIKDKECFSCAKFFNCKGKPRGIQCLHYKERKTNG